MAAIEFCDEVLNFASDLIRVNLANRFEHCLATDLARHEIAGSRAIGGKILDGGALRDKTGVATVKVGNASTPFVNFVWGDLRVRIGNWSHAFSVAPKLPKGAFCREGRDKDQDTLSQRTTTEEVVAH